MRQTLLFILLFISTGTSAQREYGVCDSTFYTFNSDTTVIAGQRKLYLQTSAGVTLLSDFTTPDTAFYIRDFDIIKPTQWYTLVGKRNIGSETYLYQSADRGQTWTLDTSYYAAILNSPASNNYYNKSINQLQRVGEDSIVLFMHYYESGIFFSVDGGSTWREWFRNLQTHYQGFLECDNYYFLYSFEGDALRPFMFPIHKSKLFTNVGGTEWYMPNNSTHPRCIGMVNGRCIYASSSLSRCEVYNFFRDTLDGACATLPLAFNTATPEATRFNIFPNPAPGGSQISITTNRPVTNVRVLDYTGRQVDASFTKKGEGWYTVHIEERIGYIFTVIVTTPSGTFARRVVVE